DTREFPDLELLAKTYGDALKEYVAGGAGEAALARAYELGRWAAVHGLGVLDMGALHHRAVGELLSTSQTPAAAAVSQAAQFFKETLSPFEMTLRAYQDSARLLGLAETAGQGTAEIDRARDQLQTILDATTAVIYLKDAAGRFIFVNRQFQQLFHVRRDAVIGKLDAEVLPAAVAQALSRHDRPGARDAVAAPALARRPVGAGAADPRTPWRRRRGKARRVHGRERRLRPRRPAPHCRRAREPSRQCLEIHQPRAGRPHRIRDAAG